MDDRRNQWCARSTRSSTRALCSLTHDLKSVDISEWKLNWSDLVQKALMFLERQAAQVASDIEERVLHIDVQVIPRFKEDLNYTAVQFTRWTDITSSLPNFSYSIDSTSCHPGSDRMCRAFALHQASCELFLRKYTCTNVTTLTI